MKQIKNRKNDVQARLDAQAKMEVKTLNTLAEIESATTEKIAALTGYPETEILKILRSYQGTATTVRHHYWRILPVGKGG